MISNSLLCFIYFYSIMAFFVTDVTSKSNLKKQHLSNYILGIKLLKRYNLGIIANLRLLGRYNFQADYTLFIPCSYLFKICNNGFGGLFWWFAGYKFWGWVAWRILLKWFSYFDLRFGDKWYSRVLFKSYFILSNWCISIYCFWQLYLT